MGTCLCCVGRTRAGDLEGLGKIALELSRGVVVIPGRHVAHPSWVDRDTLNAVSPYKITLTDCAKYAFGLVNYT